jgi:SAM-dependent methyltransferase
MMVVNCLRYASYHPAFDPVRPWARCRECGHGFANPRPAPEALRRAYEEDPPPAHLASFPYDRLVLWSDIVHALWERRPGGDFLDVGTAAGALAGVAMDYGYRVVGLNLHPAYEAPVRRLGAEFVRGDLLTAELGGRRFDVIALGDVIEYPPDPVRALARVKALLEPGGLVWLSTPNHEGVWTRALRDRDAMWLEGEHLQFFSLRSLRRLAESQGLRLVDYRLSRRFVGSAEVMLEEASAG